MTPYGSESIRPVFPNTSASQRRDLYRRALEDTYQAPRQMYSGTQSRALVLLVRPLIYTDWPLVESECHFPPHEE